MTIRLIATGGTIASVADPHSGAVIPARKAAELLESVPDIEEVGSVELDEVSQVNSWNITPATMLEVARRAQAAALEEKVDGVIVTHGTDTVEETSFLADVTVTSDKPVCFVAAMRAGDEVAADGPRNLLDAAKVSVDPAARGLGAVVVMNDEIHAARWVRKQDTFRTSAFSSPDHGPLGLVTPGSLTLLVRELERWTTRLPGSMDVSVPVVQSYTGMDESLIQTVVEATGARGLVLEGTGLGNVPGAAVDGIRAAVAKGLPVVVATRVPRGGTRAVYGGPGGGLSLRDEGVVGAGQLPAAKARLLLMVLLSQLESLADVKREFATAVAALA
jgi:L-asparaginase